MPVLITEGQQALGKRSTKENKNIYQLSREEAGLTRERASEALGFISDSRIEKYESGKSPVQPDEVLAMARAYKRPSLCNYYCSHECPIGRESVPEVETRDLAEIVLRMLATLNSLNKTRERFIEITADGEISDDELADFARIEKDIEEISLSADSLKLWVENMIASDQIDENRLDAARAAIRRS